MEQEDGAIAFDHLDSFLKSRISRIALHVLLKDIVTSPSTFQNGPEIENNFLRRDQPRIQHVELFG
jgi:hypothetical protein